MLTDIKVKIEKKVASVIGAPCIICGNSDYTVTFTFDEEWETETVKTARFLYARDAVYQFIDVVFSGNTVAVPILSGIDEVRLGVYAGELRTTTPVRIVCKKSILCATSKPHDEPAEDIYQQLLETINKLELLPTVSLADAGKALMVREDGHWVVRMPDFIHNQKDGTHFRLFLGTFEEWETWTGDKTDVMFIPTDDTTFEEILAEIEKKVSGLQTSLSDGSVVVAKATRDGNGDNIADTYAKKTGTYSGMTVGKATSATKVNNLEIKRDSNGVLKIGDTIITQKKLLVSDIELPYGIETTVYEGSGSLLNKTYEIESGGNIVKFRFAYGNQKVAMVTGCSEQSISDTGNVYAEKFELNHYNGVLKMTYRDNHCPDEFKPSRKAFIKLYEVIE